MSVEKYVINKESSNFTIIPNKVIQGLKDNLELLGFYLYLLSLPPNWSFHKNNLQETCGIGIKKLEKILRQLAQFNLIHVAQMRNAQGQFAHFDLTVYNGEYFKINNLQNAQPCVNNRPTVDGSTVKHGYKRNKETNINKEKRNISCALKKNAHESFDKFWNIYPKKKDKERARQLWVKLNCEKIESMILDDIKNRILNESTWKTEQFIPHPSTYLRNKRWEDEITLTQSVPGQKKESGSLRALRLCTDTVIN